MMSAAAVASASGRSHSRHRSSHSKRRDEGGQRNQSATSTPIKHLVVIFQENVSYDHYFGTYPHATNPSGEPAFSPARGTPTTNGLSGPLLTNNPNLDNPSRLDRSQALTCDQNHGYTAEQKAFDMGAMDKFEQNTQVESCSPPDQAPPHLVMDYYDGNTVTGMWNYAQHFAMSDNSYGDNFGPSTPGAINVTAGNTYGALCGPASAVYSNTRAPPPPEPRAARLEPRSLRALGRPTAMPTPTTTSARRRRTRTPRPRRWPWVARTSAICSIRPT
jgi:phospholipase C